MLRMRVVSQPSDRSLVYWLSLSNGFPPALTRLTRSLQDHSKNSALFGPFTNIVPGEQDGQHEIASIGGMKLASFPLELAKPLVRKAYTRDAYAPILRRGINWACTGHTSHPQTEPHLQKPFQSAAKSLQQQIANGAIRAQTYRTLQFSIECPDQLPVAAPQSRSQAASSYRLDYRRVRSTTELARCQGISPANRSSASSHGSPTPECSLPPFSMLQSRPGRHSGRTASRARPRKLGATPIRTPLQGAVMVYVIPRPECFRAWAVLFLALRARLHPCR